MSLDFIDLESRRRYRERRQSDLKVARESLNCLDFSALETIGHNLKGNGVSFGFPELSLLGEALETSAKSTNLGKAQECLDQLERWLEKTNQLCGPMLASNSGLMSGESN